MPAPDPSRHPFRRPRASDASRRPAGGFTLVELVVVVAVLGLLAAIALPRFGSLQRDARLASLQALQGAIRAAAAQGYGMCMLNPGTCRASSPASGTADPMNRVVMNGATHYFHYGYPIGWGYWNGFGAGIETMVDAGDFDIQPYVANTYFREFRVRGAPDATQCRLRYAFPALGSPGRYEVVLTTTGC